MTEPESRQFSPVSGEPANPAAVPVLSITGLTKQFPGTLALDRVDFDVEAGEIHALVGENGAGKSTLIKILAGVYPADEGEIRLRGVPYNPSAGKRIAFIHQDLGLVAQYTVAENIALVAGYPTSNRMINWRAARDRAREILNSMGSQVDPEEPVVGLTSADRSVVAIARALAVEADVLVLDEPTASLPETDVRRLFEILFGLRARGMGIVFVSHRLDEVFRIADRLTVLRDGRRRLTERVSDVSPRRLVFEIVGRELSDMFISPPPPSSEVLLELSDFKVGPVGPVSLRLNHGEILGLVGLRGSGQDAVGRAIFGAAGDWPRSGTMSLRGRQVAITSPASAMRNGIAFVSSRRAEESLAGTLTVRENIFANPSGVAHAGRRRFIRPRQEQRRIREVLDRFDVRPRDPERAIATLSGGNQQKAIVARWLEAGSQLLVLESPTFGVDVGAKHEIYSILEKQVVGGAAVLLVSSDFEEVTGIAHRALVFRRGKIVGEVPQRELSVQRLTEMASGAEHAKPGEAA